MTMPRPKGGLSAAARFALHGSDFGRDQQPTTSTHLDTLRTAPAQLRQIMNDHHAAITAVRQRVNANDDLTPEGKRNSIAAASKPIQNSTAAAVAALGTAVNNAHNTLQQQSAASLPKPASGVEGMLGRQAAWSRSQSLLSSGMSVPNLINETTDPETLHSLAEELPTYQRAQGASPDGAHAVTGRVTDRLAEVAGEPAASARLAAREADVHHAGLQPLLRQAAAEASGQAGQGTGISAAIAAQLARQAVADGAGYSPDDGQDDQPPAGTLRSSIQTAMRNAARTPRQTAPAPGGDAA
jgi:hypothetical protein